MHSPLKLGALVSSGKDSLYSLYRMKQRGHDISCVIALKSANPSSYMFHTPNVRLVALQAESMGIPLLEKETAGEKEKELEDLQAAIVEAQQKFGIQGIVTGALFSDYQRERIEKICLKLGLSCFSPLWHMDQEREMRELLREGFEIIFSSIACDGLDTSWLGRVITEKDVEKLVELHKKIGINVAGEGGEFESLVLNCTLFKKKIKIIDSKIAAENEHTAQLVITKAVLE